MPAGATITKMGRYGGRANVESPKKQAALVESEPLDPEERRQVINERPRTRAECIEGPRPCPWVGCRYHLGLDVTEEGTIVLATDDVTTMTTTCALDVADEGGVTLEVIGDLLGVTRERIRQIEDKTLRRVDLKLHRMNRWEALRAGGAL